ncbi:hypothetical protein NOX22_06175 [Enterobacter cloacae]|uniref:hypothetical protein n=1 Tax=Enterobacter cloacae complex TaxID=354276 RepID=UPI00210D4F91|nr:MULTISPECIES: hypothetical protein [Enterobacter cloacae complex]MCQ4444177.1 hypothetical protein [Enterobacter cloacae]MDW2866364.1 hypothetical protein [Enterobacter hormaechei]
MTANRSIFAMIKSPRVLLFLGGMVAGIGGMALYAFSTSPYKSVCIAPTSYYTIEDDNNATLARGIYRSYRDGLFSGHTTYIGSISHFKDGKRDGLPKAVNREVRYDVGMSGKRIHLTVTSQHRKLGGQTADEDVAEYIFPQINPGEMATSTVYLLDDKVLASGTETVARIACMN